jgi:hypothetical protein
VAWFPGSRAPAGAAPPAGHRSQALKELLGSLRPGSRHTVLDLGPSVSANVKFLSALPCRVRIADLVRALAAEPIESRRPEAMGALLERLLPLAPGERFDALLAWDVFDYMRPDQVSSLMARLAPACRPEALALVLVSTGRTIPATPLRHRILDRENLAADGPREPVRASPRYGQADLQRMMPGFSVRRSFLLRSGIQEYLFAHGEGGGAAAAREASPVTDPKGWRPWLRRGPR